VARVAARAQVPPERELPDFASLIRHGRAVSQTRRSFMLTHHRILFRAAWILLLRPLIDTKAVSQSEHTETCRHHALSALQLAVNFD